MPVKAKARVAGFLVLAAVMGIGFHLFDISKERDKDYVMLSLLVTFEPNVREIPVVIKGLVNGRTSLNDHTHESPWQESVSVAKGNLVTLVGIQNKPGQKLECTITVHGQVHGPVPAVTGTNNVSSCIVSAIA